MGEEWFIEQPQLPTGCDALADLCCDQIYKHVQIKEC